MTIKIHSRMPIAVGMLLLNMAAIGAALNGVSSAAILPLAVAVPVVSSIALTVSDGDPLYSEPVIITVTAQPSGAALSGMVTFYEDGGGSPSGDAISLQTISVSGQPSVQWSQKFLGGHHSVYAVYNSNSTLTSAAVPLNVTSAVLIPKNGIYLGSATTAGQIDTVEEPLPVGIGRPYAIDIRYYSAPWTKLISEETDGQGQLQWDPQLQDDINHGRIPLISWGCDDSASGTDGLIASGDPAELKVIKQAADILRRYPGPVMLRWKWEFNGFWASHGPCDGLSNQDRAWTPAAKKDFKGAWQQIWSVFQREQATNVVFVWNPNSYQEGGATDPHDFYPGETYVDWIGVDSYQGVGKPSVTFSNDIQPWYHDFVGDGKPMIVGENGAPQHSIEQPNEEVQWTYINGVLTDLTSSNDFPAIHAYDWYDLQNSLLDNNNGHGNGGLKAMADLGANSMFSSIKLSASSEPPSMRMLSSAYAPTLVVTNNGLLPILDARITSISDVAVTSGTGTVISLSGPMEMPRLTAGQITTISPPFTWPASATCVQMTVNVEADNESYSGSTTINVARLPNVTCP